MAEIFGVVAGSLSVAALFNNCVQCFEYIQLGRSFGRDYQACQLKLDVARVRLSRWGEALDVLDNHRFTSVSPDDKEAQIAQSIFEEICALFQSAQTKSRRYALSSRGEDTGTLQSTELSPVGQRLHNHWVAIAAQRHKNAGLVRKTAWALYDGKALGKLVGDLGALIDDLESIFPIENRSRELVELEVEEVQDTASLAVLQDAARDADQLLFEAVNRKMALIGGTNRADQLETMDEARVRIGNEYSLEFLAQGGNFVDRTYNHVGTAKTSGRAQVTIGGRYGGS
jgi:hypothetical protein